MSREQELPDGWDEEKVQRVAAHYEQQTGADAATEDDALADPDHVLMQIPADLVEEVRRLIAKRRG